MIKSKRKLSFSYLLSLVVLTTFFSACTSMTFLPKETPLTVLGLLEDAPEGELVQATIVLSKGKHVVEQTIPLTNNEFGSTITLPIGKWELTVLLLDTDGIVRYQNSPQTIQVSLNQTNLVELILRPADSQVHISIDLDGYVYESVALRARIHFNDEIHEIKRETSEEPFEANLQIPPGSYEFKIDLYTESFRVGDRLGDGVWEILDIPANQSTTIIWIPATELTTIYGKIETLLPEPTNFALEVQKEALYFTWDPIQDSQLVGYFLYMQTDPLERFELVHPLPLREPEYLLPLGSHLEANEILFTVAGVSKGGFGGYYASPLLWSDSEN